MTGPLCLVLVREAPRMSSSTPLRFAAWPSSRGRSRHRSPVRSAMKTRRVARRSHRCGLKADLQLVGLHVECDLAASADTLGERPHRGEPGGSTPRLVGITAPWSPSRRGAGSTRRSGGSRRSRRGRSGGFAPSACGERPSCRRGVVGADDGSVGQRTRGKRAPWLSLTRTTSACSRIVNGHPADDPGRFALWSAASCGLPAEDTGSLRSSKSAVDVVGAEARGLVRGTTLGRRATGWQRRGRFGRVMSGQRSRTRGSESAGWPHRAGPWVRRCGPLMSYAAKPTAGVERRLP